MFAIVIIGKKYKAVDKCSEWEEAVKVWREYRIRFPYTAIIIRNGETCKRYTMAEIEGVIEVLK